MVEIKFNAQLMTEVWFVLYKDVNAAKSCNCFIWTFSAAKNNLQYKK